jgi:hypothetical protein
VVSDVFRDANPTNLRREYVHLRVVTESVPSPWP